MSLDSWATTSNQAFAAATVVLALAWLAHLLEFAASRTVPAQTREPVLLGGGPGGRQTPTGDSERVEVFSRLGVLLSIVGTGGLLVGAFSRAMAAERVPWGNMFEFATTGATTAMVVYLLLVRLYSVQWLGAVVTGFVVVVLGLSTLVYVDAGPLVPALHSYWLVLHVAAAMTAGAAFVVGAGASAFFLLKSRAERTTPEHQRTGYLWRLPSSASMDRLAYRVHAFAFPVWTFAALIAGPIWAEYAWGRYWGWDPKEVWAFITWVVYAGYLHARATAGWRGKGAAVLALIGFATFIFNFVGINLFASGLHSYSF
jgi:cytochrome c-type biogenesis protein CcsB